MKSEPADEKWNGSDRRMRGDNNWKLDKSIPVMLLVFLIAQAVGIVWWGAKIDSREELSTTEIAGLTAWKELQSGTQSKTESRLAVIEERMGEQSETLHHIDDRLEKMLAPVPAAHKP